jgi:predicted NodU family carbamoyl transferase
MNILGISGQERDAAAALIQDGLVVAAIEEEKLARIRHIGMNYAGGLPFRAIDFCLDRGGVEFNNIDYVAYYLEPHKRFHREIFARNKSGGPWINRRISTLLRRKPQRSQAKTKDETVGRVAPLSGW